MRLFLDSDGFLECMSRIDDELRALNELSDALESLRQRYIALEDPSSVQVERLRRRVDRLVSATHSRKDVMGSVALAVVDALGSLDQAIDDAIETTGQQSATWDG